MRQNKGTQKGAKASPARLVALHVGEQARKRDAYVHEILASVLDARKIEGPERAFATKLALGVASSIGTLDEIIDRCLRSPSDVNDDVRDALRVSTYEIIFLDKSAHAAVDQGVELVKHVTVKATGLANAVLRKVVTAKEEFPFGDPAVDNASLARTHAFPLWLTERLVLDVGRERAEQFMQASNEDAPLFIAVNALRASDEEIEKTFASLGFTATAVGGSSLKGCYRIHDARSLQNSQIKALFTQGKILVSDAASQMIATLALPEKFPRSFLEVGSGRATKTILLQSNAYRRWGRQMHVTTVDMHTFKQDLLVKRAATYGVQVNAAHVHDATDLAGLFSEDQQFDAVFIDAPCSGLGTLRRHPEIRWRLKSREIDDLTALGKELLNSAASFIAPGGMLTYATCTVVKAENEGVVNSFLKSDIGALFRVLPFEGRGAFSTQLVSGSSDAHFAVRMVQGTTVV